MYKALQLVTPEKVQEHWPALRQYILGGRNSVYADTPTNAANMLEGLLTGYMQLWLVLDDTEIVAVFTTSLTHHYFADVNYMTIETAHTMRDLPDEAFAALMARLEEFCRIKKAVRIVTYVSQDSAERLQSATGMTPRCVLMQRDVL